MKKIFMFLLAGCFGSIGFSQTFQATIKSGSLPNSVIFAIKPSATVNNAKLTTLYFSIAVPATVLPKPSVSILTNFNTALAYTIQNGAVPEMVAGSPYYIYNFLADGSVAAGVERNYTAVDNNMLEITFGGGPVVPVSSTIRVVSLANGGLTANSFFNVYNLGTDVTNQAAMFYGGAPVNSASGYTGTSYTTLPNVVLPIKFLGLTASRRDNNAVLNWQIENENALTDRYEIERSLDGAEFKKVDALAPKNNGISSNSYDFTDFHITDLLSSGIFYYRIKQFDKDGKFTYSNVASIRINTKGAVALYPNPTHKITNLSIDLPDAVNVSIIISEAAGKQVQKIEFKGAKGLNLKPINLEGLATGSYSLKISAGDLVQTISLIKAK